MATLEVVLVTVILLGMGYLGVRPWMLRWGATRTEAERPMAGDDLIAASIMSSTRAIEIAAPAERIWPWLAQMGQGRGGFCSYDWLENALGMDIHNVDQILPELQDPRPGGLIPFWRGAGVNVAAVAPPHLLVLAGTLVAPKGEGGAAASEAGGTWVFAVEEHPAGTTRLVIRSRVARSAPAWLAAIMMRLMELMHFIMERRMLLGIRERAERAQRAQRAERAGHVDLRGELN